MKIGTDGILLGAWADFEGAKTILDVGTGTGLLALMAAQKQSSAKVYGVEIVPEAAEQAAENMQASPWADRLEVIAGDIRELTFSHPVDALICNPPFFQNSLPSPDQARTFARHSDSLSLADLLKKGGEILITSGRLSLILPALMSKQLWELAARYDFHVKRFWEVKPRVSRPAHRILVELRKAENAEIERGEIYLHKEGKNEYSTAYHELTRDFYKWLAGK